jgi:Protein of unknown function (DUF3619)
MSYTNQQIDTLRSGLALELAQERFALRLTSRLSDATDALPHDLSERLRVSRQQAVAKRKLASLTSAATATAVSRAGGGTLTMGAGGNDGFSLWNAIASALPLVALVVGLFVINNIQNDNRAREVAEVDAALLTDDLPPAAYADPGFVQFLKARREASQ